MSMQYAIALVNSLKIYLPITVNCNILGKAYAYI